MNNDKQNRRIHELLGNPIWHEFRGGTCVHCDAGPSSVGCDVPDYFNDITAAREALQFAVEQKGAIAVGNALLASGLELGAGGKEVRKQINDARNSGQVVDLVAASTAIAVALAPASVLCETFLSVMTEGI